MHSDEHVRSALMEAEARFLRLRNVRAIDYGIPRRDGVLMPEERAIRIHVHRTLDAPGVEAAASQGLTEVFPDSIQGIPIDVLDLGSVHPQRMSLGARRGASLRIGAVSDPLEGGIGVGPLASRRAGTLGAIVLDRSTRRPMVLSNHHVLWDSGAAQRIIQPSRLEGGSHDHIIGQTRRHALEMKLDGAIAGLTTGRGISVHQKDLGNVRGLAVADLGTQVRKSGFASGVTSGIVTGINVVVPVRSRGVVRRFRNALFIEPEAVWREVSRPGDSGALWLNGDMEAVALHFAGTNRPEKAFALDLTAVLQALSVALLIDSR